MKSKKEKDKDKSNVYTVTPQGSLGLLALGHVGLIKWREAIHASKSKSKIS